eukprot:802661-Prorocentrum_lima.AAC.1
MTSSLVGSEMCIRDSCKQRRLDPGSFTGRLSTEALINGLTSWRVRPAAVSYTHLTLPTICSV